MNLVLYYFHPATVAQLFFAVFVVVPEGMETCIAHDRNVDCRTFYSLKLFENGIILCTKCQTPFFDNGKLCFATAEESWDANYGGDSKTIFARALKDPIPLITSMIAL